MEMNGKLIQYILEQNNEKEHGSQYIKFIEDNKNTSICCVHSHNFLFKVMFLFSLEKNGFLMENIH